PLSLPASNTSQKFRGYGIVWILPTNRFELGLGAFIITLAVIFVEGLRQLRLDQLRPELYGHVQGLARGFTSLCCLTDIINECQAVLPAQVRPSDGELRVKPHCVLECVYRFLQARSKILDVALESEATQLSVVGVRVFRGSGAQFSFLLPPHLCV